ncbi:hypothetical protein CPC735_016610 [Coccidioides posadasii C735 delta SOWgp]|uniref:Magnesium chelatase n=1 Tax=Coccidioides posadasii (strain C735) TaxID=222929 RepID=C5PD99_COCP7|nr:hypothetical protein CPC735_016610 [Coccidioides posadasii C735 delta SOWgp]EER25060.1 hypothetical protein CPC735_016610 [Coccidioides posadasii C735 delta SOWgp]|eukprot:XP_003067205.1 hypothetical protein CPC735_016610 [Coccidioides posadasii C735 delta SOWgp]
MADNTELYDKLEDLSDLEIALLLCLVSQEHGIIDTDPEAIDDLGRELSLIVENTFGLSNVVFDGSPHTSLEEFSNAILTPERDRNESRRSRYSQSSADSRLRQSYLDDRKVVNVIIAKRFDQTPDEVQVQALELIRLKRIFTRTAVHNTPKTFLFIPLVAANGKPLSSLLNKHLNDHIFVSHFHDAMDGFANLEDDSGWISDGAASSLSVVRPSSHLSPSIHRPRPILEEEITILRRLGDSVTISADMTCYLHNFIVFLRLHRGVSGGISAASTCHFQTLARFLAPLQRLDCLVPSLVAIAAKKAYRHRIVVARPKDDRSLLYGSSLAAARSVLADLTPESIIEEVLTEVEAPL